MGLFYNEIKKEPAKSKPRHSTRGHIPIESMNKLGCSVCPRDKDTSLRSPKMKPSGSELPLVYLLGTGPNDEEDDRNEHWVGIAGRAIRNMFSRSFFEDEVRSSHITQCMPAIGGPGHPEVAEIECCRGRVVTDIEQHRPIVVVGVGDEPLHWATGLPRSALMFHGTLIATRIGRHACWYYPIIYPNYTKGGRKSDRKSPYEMVLENDVRWIEDAIEGGLEPPTVYDAPYDGNIELITGDGAGDMVRLEEALHATLKGPNGFDLETNCIKPFMHPRPLILTAALGTFEKTYAFPVMLDEDRDGPAGWGTETRMKKVSGMLGEWIAQSGRKRCHNTPFEQEWSAYTYGNQILRRTEWDDTMVAAYVQDARKGTKSLDVQCRIHLGFFLKDQSRVDVSRDEWWKTHPLKESLRYNALDAKWTDKLTDVQLANVGASARLEQLYEDNVRLGPTLVLTTARGFPVDFVYAEAMVDDLQGKMNAVEEKLRKSVEVREYSRRFGSFSITNDDHVLKLMQMLNRPEIKREDYDGNIKLTTDEEALSAMTDLPLARLILDHRQIRRNVTTYLGPLVDGKMTGPDGMLHAEYRRDTVTSRLSSEIHNWPKHKYREVRGAIAEDLDHWLVAADYGQIEFRVCGMLSEDKNIVKYSWTKYDVHKYWAERAVDEYGRIKDWIVDEFDVDWDEKGIKTLRQVMKNMWVFPQLFGATLKSCAVNCHIPLEVAEILGAEFWDEFAGHKRWQEKLLKGYAKHLYVETLGGWRRSGVMTLNEAINAPIQGTACEIVLEAMNALSERADREENIEIQPAFNGHDDLTFRISDSKLESNVAIIAEEMCKPRFDYINCPLIVEVSVGPRWHQLEEIAKYSSEDLYRLPNPYKEQHERRIPSEP